MQFRPPSNRPATEPKMRYAERLMIVRMSDSDAVVELEAMLERTLRVHAGQLSGISEIRDRGVTPIKFPDPAKNERGGALPSGAGRWALYQVQDTWVLLLLGSATASGASIFVVETGHQNAVVARIERTLSELRPREVLLGPFDRVNRSTRYAEDTWSAMLKADVEVIRFDDPQNSPLYTSADGAWETFHMLSTRAHENLQSVVIRTMKGKAHLALDQRWHLASDATPLGLTVDSDRRLIVDEDELAAVAMIVRGFARGDTAAAITRHLMYEGAVPRRRGTPGFRQVKGRMMSTGAEAEEQRIEHRVNKFAAQLADLAMGKLVLPWCEPQSATQALPGI